MTSQTRFRRRFRPRLGGLRARRGIALFVAMFMVVAIGALALSAIYLTANATLISKTYEKEDDLKYAAEAALAVGRANLNYVPGILPNTSFVTLMSNKTMTAADAQPVPGVKVNLYAGPTGKTSGQFGTFASLVAEARDNNGTGFVRRLELTQESFAKFAYWSNTEGGTIYFGGGDALWGPVWSNDTIKIASSHATFNDAVGTAAIVSGAGYGTYLKGYQEHQRPILLPTLTKLAGLAALATTGGFNFTAPTTGSETTVRMRMEFVAADMNADTDSLDTNEGFFRLYTATAGNQAWLRGDWVGSSAAMPDPTVMLTCGDWHAVVPGGPLKFFPFSVHYHSSAANTWYDTVTAAGRAGGFSTPALKTANVAASRVEADSVKTTTKFTALMGKANARCFLGGDPHLVAVARQNVGAGPGYYAAAADVHKGGDDTTFTAIDQYGSWSQFTATPNATILAARPADAGYLYPLYRGFNPGTKGVLYVAGTVGVSGVLNGDITLYTPNSIVILDDLSYANNPAAGHCIDMMGLIAGQNIVVADNALNAPQWIKVGGSPIVRSFDDSPDLTIHGVMMALNTSFSVENYGSGATTAVPCGATTWGRGCLFLTGGVIQNTRGPVATGAGTGYLKRYSYDRCAVSNPPPYFPTTGRFLDNRYYELDPVRFNVTNLYHTLAAP